MFRLLKQKWSLSDSKGRKLGYVNFDRADVDHLLGQFRPGPDFGAVEEFFREFEELVNQQIFPLADEIADQIDGLGLCLLNDNRSQKVEIFDVQIFNGTDFSCRREVQEIGTSLDGESHQVVNAEFLSDKAN